LKSKGVTPKDFHDLDDFEFYTELGDAIEVFNSMYGSVSGKDRLEHAKAFIGVDGPAKAGFFDLLKRVSKGKWQKAAKEFTKAVL
jgi:hypothetical protein